jgi:hypothetical protein
MKAITVKLNFVHYEWDNYQGASGTVIQKELLIDVPANEQLSNLKDHCINYLLEKGYCNDWGQRGKYHENGIISITIF